MRHLHSMLVNSEEDNFEGIYRAVKNYLSKGFAVIYSAEQASSIQVLQKLTQTGILPDAEDYVQSGLLRIIDGNIVRRQKSQHNATDLAELLFSVAAETRRKSDAKRVVVLCNADFLLQNGDYSKQIDFEEAINRRFESNGEKQEEEIICCYNYAKIENLSLSHLIKLVNAHTSIVRKDWEYYKWYPSMVMEIITRGIEKPLDFKTAQLILKTLKLIYKIDENTIISNPIVFEETLQKVLGDNAAVMVLSSIKEEAKRRIMP